MSGSVSRDVLESRRGLVYQVRGTGAPVLLVHGWCLNRTVWMYQEHALLEAGFQAISVDLAGFGESRGLSGPFTLERHGDDLADLLDERGLDRVVTVGFAYGAAVIMSMPRYDRVSGAVAIGIPNASGAPYLKMRSAMLRDWPLFARRSAAAICGAEHSDEALAWLGGVFASTPLPSAIAGVEVLARFEPLELPPGGRPPVTFVHGRDDAIVSPEVSEAAAAHFAGGSVEILPGSGHFVPWDQPAQLSRIIIERATAAS